MSKKKVKYDPEYAKHAAEDMAERLELFDVMEPNMDEYRALIALAWEIVYSLQNDGETVEETESNVETVWTPDISEQEDVSMNDKQIAYYMEHWNEYNLVDSKEDMLRLLNILMVHGENLDTLHDVACNGRDEICGIFGTYDDDQDVVSTLFEYHHFFLTKDGLMSYIRENALEHGNSLEEEFRYMDVRKSRDGYIVMMHC